MSSSLELASIVIPNHYLLRNLGSSNQESVPSYTHREEIDLSQYIDSVKEEALGSFEYQL